MIIAQCLDAQFKQYLKNSVIISLLKTREFSPTDSSNIFLAYEKNIGPGPNLVKLFTSVIYNIL